MLRNIFILIILFLLPFLSELSAQSCGCDHTITQSGIYSQSTSPGTFNLNILPGQTVCIAAGNYTLLRFRNFVGSATQPIVFKNCGGLVTLGHNTYYAALDFQGCKYFQATGSGDPSITYGIRVDSCGTASAMSVGALSSDCEVDHIEVAEAGFAGIMVKTDPDCNSNTWGENFTMYNVNIHDNYVHDVGGEGFYVGNSFFGSGMTRTCNGTSMQVYPHNILNLQIHDNMVRRSGAECLQYACAPGAQVYNNDLGTCGISPFASYQNNGLQCGGGAGGDCYNNRVRNVAGSGLIVIGHLGNNRFYNNLIANSGGDGIFCDERTGSLSNTYCDFINNTIVNSGRDAIRLYNQLNSIVLANNVMVGTARVTASGTCLVFQQGATATQLTNYCSTQFNTAAIFTDTTTYEPLPGSPLIDLGTNVSGYGVTLDLAGRNRPFGAGFDLGALESEAVVVPIELMDFQGLNTPNGNYLSWHFAQAEDLRTVELQKSADARQFTTLAICTDKYVTDYTPFPLTYYRLKMTERNGKVSFSKTIAVHMEEKRGVGIVSVSPNPASDFVVVQLENSQSMPLTVEVFDGYGHLMYSKSCAPEAIELTLDTHSWPAGGYVLKVSDGRHVEVARVVK